MTFKMLSVAIYIFFFATTQQVAINFFFFKNIFFLRIFKYQKAYFMVFDRKHETRARMKKKERIMWK